MLVSQALNAVQTIFNLILAKIHGFPYYSTEKQVRFYSIKCELFLIENLISLGGLITTPSASNSGKAELFIQITSMYHTNPG